MTSLVASHRVHNLKANTLYEQLSMHACICGYKICGGGGIFRTATKCILAKSACVSLSNYHSYQCVTNTVSDIASERLQK